ncbi:MAG: tripartite tricarboxylate transporter TctB family protein [Deltaproteobacteria bacterium]|nr:tripartite tricarboxylate transporter TctB family protein [Deltaproteobacteria bacterium]
MHRDTGIGIGLLALCALLYWQAGLVSAPPFVPIGPAFYPRVVLLLLAGLALWLIVEDLLRQRSPAPVKAKPTQPAPNYRRVLLGFIVFFGYVAGLSFVGYPAATFLFVLGLGWSIGPHSVRELLKLTVIAVGTTLATYLIFEKYLYVFLPRGLLF